MPVVSVLMACHRDTPFLRPAIASVLRQTFTDLELVLVDNGAGLDLGSLGNAGRDPRLRLIRFPENRGIPVAHNAAVAAAQGEYIALLDHDDIMRPLRLERQVTLLASNRQTGLVSSLAETIDATGKVVGREFSLIGAEAQRRYLAYSTPVVTPAYTGRRELFTLLPYRGQFSLTADFDFLARASERQACRAVPEVLLHYRRHATQATQEHAAQIEHQRGLVRLCTARRRAGREEGLGEAGAEASSGTPADTCLSLATRALAEGFPLLAAFQARRAVALDRGPAVAARAAWLGAQAIRSGPERSLIARMFFQGPVRALQVRPE